MSDPLVGCGSAPCGLGPCGLDPLPPPVPPRSATPPVALWFDGGTKDFLLDPVTGQYKSLHPVDQAVALALLVGLGTVTSAPSVGAGFRTITRITPSTQSEATNMANAALATLVNAGQVQILQVQVTVFPFPGAIEVVVFYRNLITRTTPSFATPSGTFTGT